ncbi:AAA family ATPase [Nocardia asteroides]|uniref:AAA family ATPase n=1 Tax=Nocardia asteroides TaxID=1824 RepID=UPI001E3004DB|nr:AAA family ATPase [Nocardia asteroides]UGT63947.1 AAA family ATPase [Nocardia asteroides]
MSEQPTDTETAAVSVLPHSTAEQEAEKAELETLYRVERSKARVTELAKLDGRELAHGDYAAASRARARSGTASGLPATGGGLPVEFVNGADFILRAPSIPPAWWGDGAVVLAARGEATMLCGTSGLGKTTLEGQLVHASLGLAGAVLGQPVVECRRVLVLAMDRPQQIARAFGRIFTAADESVLSERLVLRPGPPAVDIAKNPDELLAICEAAGLQAGDRLFVDSLKDAAVGLSEDVVGSGYNRARQMVLNAGIDVFELHHMVKRAGDGSGPPKTLADVYGSTWLTSGAGSVFVLTGDAGDTFVTMTHLKTPMEPFGPLTIVHDHRTGVTSADPKTDVLELVAAAGSDGITAKACAAAMFGKTEPDRNEIDRARRKLAGLTKKGLTVEHKGSPGGGSARTETVWTAAVLALPTAV